MPALTHHACECFARYIRGSLSICSAFSNTFTNIGSTIESAHLSRKSFMSRIAALSGASWKCPLVPCTDFPRILYNALFVVGCNMLQRSLGCPPCFYAPCAKPAYICLLRDRAPGGDDAYFVNAGDSGALDIGVFDGVGGWASLGHDPGVFSRGFAKAAAGSKFDSGQFECLNQ